MSQQQRDRKHTVALLHTFHVGPASRDAWARADDLTAWASQKALSDVWPLVHSATVEEDETGATIEEEVHDPYAMLCEHGRGFFYEMYYAKLMPEDIHPIQQVHGDASLSVLHSGSEQHDDKPAGRAL